MDITITITIIGYLFWHPYDQPSTISISILGNLRTPERGQISNNKLATKTQQMKLNCKQSIILLWFMRINNRVQPTIEWVNQWINEWTNERTNERLNEWVNNERTNEWLNEWVNKWVSEWMIEWVSEWVSKWVGGYEMFVYLLTLVDGWMEQ